ncbi:MAG: hypothetical protein CMI95_01125, partial [Pelagibacteraceae bacterium]|nr:hypothetical protein [Pelagibacteraceae bacterium]
KLKDMYQAQYGRLPPALNTPGAAHQWRTGRLNARCSINVNRISWLITVLRYPAAPLTCPSDTAAVHKWFKLVYPEVWQWYNEMARGDAGRQLAEVRRKARHKWKINTEAAVAIQRAWLAKKKLKEQEVVAVYVPPAEAIDTESIASAPLAEAIDTEPELKGQYGF